MLLRVADNHSHNVLITGGAGFVGANLAANLLGTTDARITLYDNLSRPGAEANVAWLKALADPRRLNFTRGDVRNSALVSEVARTAHEIYHCVARCSGVNAADIRTDYAVNVTGTVNVLEGARRSGRGPRVLFASTSKVYGTLKSIPVTATGSRYSVTDSQFRGVSERTPVDLGSPFSCSKGAAERRVREYAQKFGLSAVILRLGTVAGPRQFPAPAGGWIAHFVDAVMTGCPINVGDDLQVRDVLHVADLLSAMNAAMAYIGITAGKVYNVGGGMSRAVSVKEMLGLVERICHRSAEVHHARPTRDDQLLYVSDSSAFCLDTGWLPQRSVVHTVRDVVASWHAHHAELVSRISIKNLESLKEAA